MFLLKIKKLIVMALAKKAIDTFVFSTRFGKQTYSKRAIRTVWNASRR